MTEGRIAAIVLAAGSSTRLGRPKQLLRVSGRPLLEHTLDVVRASSLNPRLLVLGAHSREIEAAVSTRSFDVIHNDDFASGQASSLRTAIESLPEDVAGAVVLLGDQPLVPPWLLDSLAARFDPAIHAAVRPRYAGGPGNPVLLCRRLFPELAVLTGDVGARDVLQRHAGAIAELDMTARVAPRDVDTEDDYAQLLLEWSAAGAPDVPRYCQRCATELVFREIHHRSRPVCPSCGFTCFYDPKIAAVVVVEIDGRIVLQQRSIDPGRGKWTFPGGFVDRGEALPEAAARETREEVGLDAQGLTLLGLYSEPGETVVLVAFHATAAGQMPSIGDESADVRSFSPDELPELAFHRDRLVIDDWLKR
ncbi:MAG TPA: NTP transferase domain-containing protein [Thermomicrobiales bacterium]|nr:NTP transferase domain-containing protein [Thermomicrobiales bacterium]